MAATALMLLTAEVVRPQEIPQVQVGSRVRVRPAGPGQSWLTGNLLELPGDSVRLLTGDTHRHSVAIALNSVANFERSQGVRPRTGKGALIGLGTGALAGLILGVALYEECTAFCVVDPGRAGSGALGALLGALFGTGIGALFGATVRADRWVPVEQPWGADLR
jgi:hypothetical protein